MEKFIQNWVDFMNNELDIKFDFNTLNQDQLNNAINASENGQIDWEKGKLIQEGITMNEQIKAYVEAVVELI
jgi:threonine dehydrogenase-like Zn-dependent dehydrogenase